MALSGLRGNRGIHWTMWSGVQTVCYLFAGFMVWGVSVNRMTVGISVDWLVNGV